ncbi:MAG: NAD(P)/FAD-dependent oxidoreductase [Acidobacteriaceae bacterium]|nr:NAD(P)/FAD-dependent oxidoreductase [Acidobacteriaceae bacterium]
MPALERIAVIGGGPAGAFAASELARAGREVLLFDEKLAWEKPCGGGLTDKALAQWPFLRDAPVERNWVSDCELIAPSGRQVRFRLERHIAIFSRLTLNGLLLERARQVGAQLRRERVLQIDKSDGGWAIRTASGGYTADFVVIAAGARNSLRNGFAAPLGPENFMVAAGYYIPGNHHTVQIKFLKGLHGYIWIFSRADHFSAGICGRMQGKSTAELRRLLENSLPEFGLNLDGASFYAHIIPSLTPDALRNSSFAGEGWAMVGDAAGFVDAITGEGLYYALRSAELLTEALLANAPEKYPALAKSDFLPELERAARIADRFYGGEWMAGPVVERMIQLTECSPRFRDIMRDLFVGAQEYSDLRERVYQGLPRIAAETVVSGLRNPFGTGQTTQQGKAGRLAGVENRTQ